MKITSDTRKTLYERRKEEGLCTKCGKIAYKNLTMCITCKNKASVANKKRYEKMKASGELQRRRAEKIENKICFQCGSKVDSEKVLCEICNNKHNQRRRKDREFYRENHICPICTINPLFGTEGTCPECRAKNTEAKAKYREEHKEEHLKYQRHYQKQNYAKNKELGICTKCGKRKADEGLFTCSLCRAKINARRQEKRGIPRCERNSYGLCYICAKPLDRDGKACTVCAERSRQNLKNTGNSGWKRTNSLLFKKRKAGVSNG